MLKLFGFRVWATHAFNEVQVQHYFYHNFPPPLATHAFDDSSSSTTFLLSIFSRPLATHALRPYLTTFLLSKSSHPPWQPMLCDPTWQHSFYVNFPPPLGNPCFATLPDNIPFIKFYPPLATHAFNDWNSSTTFLLSIFSPPLGNPCFATLPDNIPFITFSPPLATHAFNDSSSSTTFLLSKFPPPLATHALRPYLTTFLLSKFSPPWQPMLCDPTWQHSFYQNLPPPLGNPCFATLPDNIPLIKFSPPLATHAFNDSSSSTTFLLSKISPPPWQPMLCDPTWQHSFYQISPPLATHAFNDSSSSTTFLLCKFSRPLATHALRPYLTTFFLSNFIPPWQPMLSMIEIQVQHSFYVNFPPPWQPMLCDPTWQHSFYQILSPLGNPCFQWLKFKYNIPFM